MNSVSALLILVGLWVVLNAINGNLIGVFNHTMKLNIDWTAPTTAQTQAALPLTSKSTSSGG